MARIAGIELPEDKRIDFSLTRIYGIGWVLGKKVLEEAGIDPAKKTKLLTSEETASLSRQVEKYKTEGDLRREVRANTQRLKDISSYRGIRHKRSLPVRGQRTRTNARTKRGKRKTVGAFKKETLAKIVVEKGVQEGI